MKAIQVIAITALLTGPCGGVLAVCVWGHVPPSLGLCGAVWYVALCALCISTTSIPTKAPVIKSGGLYLEPRNLLALIRQRKADLIRTRHHYLLRWPGGKAEKVSANCVKELETLGLIRWRKSYLHVMIERLILIKRKPKTKHRRIAA